MYTSCLSGASAPIHILGQKGSGSKLMFLFCISSFPNADTCKLLDLDQTRRGPWTQHPWICRWEFIYLGSVGYCETSRLISAQNHFNPMYFGRCSDLFCLCVFSKACVRYQRLLPLSRYTLYIRVQIFPIVFLLKSVSCFSVPHSVQVLAWSLRVVPEVAAAVEVHIEHTFVLRFSWSAENVSRSRSKPHFEHVRYDCFCGGIGLPSYEKRSNVKKLLSNSLRQITGTVNQ